MFWMGWIPFRFAPDTITGVKQEQPHPQAQMQLLNVSLFTKRCPVGLNLLRA